MNFLELLKKFLYKNMNSKQPVLLAYSGGVDSSCLLDVLIQCKKHMQVDFHVVHIDHGWRKESKKEAQMIEKKMKKLGVCFHFKRFKITSDKNLENESRNRRLAYFKELFEKYDYQALLLAHQKDDLAETVLKRVLEGANIFSLTSMLEVSRFENMVVWRPFLKVSRKDILSYLAKNNVEYFLDKTNEDVKYLRAKMRKDIFPYLQKNFNKEIMDNLVCLSSYSAELNNYLEEKTKFYLKELLKGPLGICIDLNPVKELLEIKFIIKKIAFLKNLDLSRNVLNQLSYWIINKKPNLRLKLKGATLFADRGYFFVLEKRLDTTGEKFLIKEKEFDYGLWKVKIDKVARFEKNSIWTHLFNNKIFIYLPENKYFICYPVNNRKLKKIWENNKVPSFLRKMVPVVCDENKITYDFLSGRKIQLKNKKILRISLRLK